MKICILAKNEKPGLEEAISFAESFIDDCDVFCGEINDPIPGDLSKNYYDILISYISPWIVPMEILEKTKKWNINFHPGPPEYPGIGCFNFAIFDKVKHFGTTAHIMNPQVDTGEIIGVNRFSINNDETVKSLSEKSYSSQLVLYKEILEYIVLHNKLPVCEENWKRKPFKRYELEQLATIDPSMGEDEINERIRATYYPQKPAPFIEIYGHRFEYNPER